MIARLAACALGLALALSPAAAAQSNPFEASRPGAEGAAGAGFLPAADAAVFSKEIERALAERGARLAIVFRSGRDRDDLPDGVRYTHGAFWVYSSFATPEGETLEGYAVYNLYVQTEGEATSYLEQDLPFDFTRPMKVPEAGIIVPTPGLQGRILEVMASDDYAALHQPSYSLISNPHDLRHQNCNEFMLDVIAAALWRTADRAQLKANLAAHFTPAEIETSPLQRFFAPLADHRLRTDDHDGEIRTATFRSMADFLIENGYASEVFELEYSGAAQLSDS